MANNPVRVAVIGAGNMGRHHVRNYAELKEAELVAVVDANPAVKELAEKHGAKYFSDYKAMLEEMKPEAVSVVVPTPLHAQIGAYVMERGIHCIVEKPIASTVDEANELIALAERKKLVFTVGHIERYNPIVRKLKEMIDAKKLGEVTSVVSKRVGGFPATEPKTDVFIDLAVHDIEIISYLLGRFPQAVYSHGSQTLHSARMDSAELLLDYGDASGFIQANWITPVKVRTIAITGSDGYLEGNYVTQELFYYSHNMGTKKARGNFKDFVSMVSEQDRQLVPVDFQEPLALELRLFLQTIRGEVKKRLVSPTAAREALRVALLAAQQQEVARNARKQANSTVNEDL